MTNQNIIIFSQNLLRVTDLVGMKHSIMLYKKQGRRQKNFQGGQQKKSRKNEK